MAKYEDLAVGQKIRITKIPDSDLAKYERTHDDFTVRVLRRLVDTQQAVTITEIDEHGKPWFDYSFTNDEGEREIHSLAIMCEDDSWERVEEDM